MKAFASALIWDLVTKYINVNYGMMVTTQGREVQYRDIVNKPDYYQDQEDFFSYQIYTKAKASEHEQEVRLYLQTFSYVYENFYLPNSIKKSLTIKKFDLL
mgnify:CR=1 FL=1